MEELIYELVIKNEDDEVFAISLVNSPAIEKNFVYFSKEKEQFSVVNEEKRLLCGAIMIPDKKILRLNEKNEKYYVFFTKDTIKQLAHKYLIKSYQNNTTIEHTADIQGVSLVESWLVDNPIKDKSNNYNMTLPTGSWVGIFKVNNDDIWEEYIKTNEVKGFSIEGMFDYNVVENSDELELDKLDEKQSEEILKKIINMFNDK